MTITALQREKRAQGIGSSEVAAILGESPWQTAADVQMVKLGLVDEPDEIGELAEIGTAIEAGIAQLAAKRLGVRLVKPTATFVHESGVLRANPDRLIEEPRRGQPGVECKDSGLDHAWGRPDDAQPLPPYVLLQVCHQMVCVGADEWHVARLGRGFARGLFMYEIHRRDDVARLCDLIEDVIPRWWQRHIVNAEPLPEGEPPPSFEVLRRVRREPASVVSVEDELVEAVIAARAEAREAEARKEEAERALLAAMGTAEGAVSSAGKATYLEQRRKGYTVAPTAFRVLRVKESK